MSRFLRNILARRILRRRIAKRVKDCFEGIDLTRHSFNVSGQLLATRDGQTQFYVAAEIDRAIANINTLLNELRS